MNSIAYWNQQEATINGVLGGYGHLNRIDVAHSEDFLLEVKSCVKGLEFVVVADVGCGIGRTTKYLLGKLFEEADMFEPVEKMRKQIPNETKGLRARISIYENPVQKLKLQDGRYDVIWYQWVAMYLDSDKLVESLIQSKHALKSNGVIVIKDNTNTMTHDTIFDPQDCSYVRTFDCWMQCFDRANMRVILHKKQRKWPKHLYSVIMFALQKDN